MTAETWYIRKWLKCYSKDKFLGLDLGSFEFELNPVNYSTMTKLYLGNL